MKPTIRRAPDEGNKTARRELTKYLKLSIKVIAGRVQTKRTSAFPEVLRDYPQGDSNPLVVSPKDKPAKDVTENTPETLARSLARKFENDPELARLVDAWPALPEPIRLAILALVESGRSHS
jgi:hypothetical protein